MLPSLWLNRLPRPRLGINTLLLLVTLYLSCVLNHAFWRQVLQRLPHVGWNDAGLLLALFIAMNVLLLTLMLPISFTRIVKPSLGVVIILASVCAYFMDAYGAIIDTAMIGNLFQTDPREASEFLSFSLLLHVTLGGVVPALMLQRIELQTRAPLAELLRRTLLPKAPINRDVPKRIPTN